MRSRAAVSPFTPARATASVQQSAGRLQREQRTVPFLNGKACSITIPPTASASASHGLGRVPRGYLVTDHTGDPLYSRTAWDAQTITLQNAGATACTLGLWLW